MSDKSFFDAVRPHFPRHRLTQGQIDGINAIIAGFTLYGNGDVETLAYCLATAKHETANTMQPITEIGNRAYFNKYEPGTPIGKRLGNTLKGDGYRFRGRGLVQLTGRANYKKAGDLIGVDLVANPERALEQDNAVRLLVQGASEGWYTGKKLSDYIDGIDESDEEDLREFLEARRTINGKDKAELIGRSALVFEHALNEAGVVSAPAPTPEPAGKPLDLSWVDWKRVIFLAAMAIGGLWFVIKYVFN